MKDNVEAMKGFAFLLGEWELEYRIPASHLSPEATGSGQGRMRRILNDRFVAFDYTCEVTTGTGAAHAVIGWDAKAKVYRFWWFEDSGSFMTASCDFVGGDHFMMNWHNSLLRQEFKKTGPDEVTLTMEHPDAEGSYKPVLTVIMKRAG